MIVTSGLAQENDGATAAIEGLKKFDKVRDFTMSQSGNEAYYTLQSPTEEVSVICTSIKKNGDWSTPKITSFSGKYKDLEAFLTQDGLRLYFVSNRPLNDSIPGQKDFDIWYVERANLIEEWSEPVNMGNPINTEHNEFYPALSKNGNLYFTSDNPKGKGRDDIFFSAFKNGGFTDPISLGEHINSEGFEYNAYISHDESYLLFGGYNREDGLGSGDIYISFNEGKGNWSQAKPLPKPINSAQMDYCPFVDEENNTIYFTSRRVTLPNSRFDEFTTFETYINSYENGNSRLYKTDFQIEELRKKIQE